MPFRQRKVAAVNIGTVSSFNFKGVYFSKSAQEYCSAKAKQKIKKLAHDPHSSYQKDVFVQAFKPDDSENAVIKVDVYNLYKPVYKEGKLESVQRVYEQTYFGTGRDFDAVPMTRK